MFFCPNLLPASLRLLLLLPELLKIGFNFDSKMLLEMYAYSWPVLIANFSYLINENLDKICWASCCRQTSACTMWVFTAPALKYRCSSAFLYKPSAWVPNLSFSAMPKTKMPAKPMPALWIIL